MATIREFGRRIVLPKRAKFPNISQQYRRELIRQARRSLPKGRYCEILCVSQDFGKIHTAVLISQVDMPQRPTPVSIESPKILLDWPSATLVWFVCSIVL